MLEEYKKLVKEQDALMERIARIALELSGEAYTDPQREAMAKWLLNLDLTMTSANTALRLIHLKV